MPSPEERRAALKECQQRLDRAEQILNEALAQAELSASPSIINKVRRLSNRVAHTKSRIDHKSKAIETYYKGEFCFDGD